MIDALAQIFAAYVLTDAFSGVYHYVTDRGWNHRTIVAWFQKHHEQPETMTFDLMPALIGVPFIVAAFWVSPWFLASFGAFMSAAQLPHYYTHHPAPRAVRLMQSVGLIVRPEHHEAHHGDFDRNFCVFTGWNDWWLNSLVKR